MLCLRESHYACPDTYSAQHIVVAGSGDVSDPRELEKKVSCKVTLDK